jgi:hypothetical protein
MGSQFTTIRGIPIVIGVYLAKSYLFARFKALQVFPATAKHNSPWVTFAPLEIR